MFHSVQRPWLGAVLLCLLASTSAVQATEYYMTPTGGTSPQNGSSWTNAFPKTQMATVLSTTMVAGDTLYLGSGNYGTTVINLSGSGAAGNPKKVIGVDTGSGLPLFDTNDWSRAYPDASSAQWSILSINSSYWTVENLHLKKAKYAIKSGTNGPYVGITLRNISVTYARHGLYVTNCDDLLVEDCSISLYTKQGYRLDAGCENVTFNNCLADLCEDDTSWWDYSEAFPFGFIVNNGGASNSNVVFNDCVAKNNRQNLQGISYWNGDGFVVESNTTGTTQFNRCIAINNEDGGFDIKPTVVWTDCVSVRNYRGFRGHSDAVTKTLNNCVAIYPFRRSTSNPDGFDGGQGIHFTDDTITANYFTFHGDVGTGVYEDGSGSITLYDSIISFSGSSGGFTYGAVTLGAGTVTYRPGSGTDPDYVNPTSTWDGTGDDMNSLTYGVSKGYYFADTLIVAPEADTYVWDGGPSTNFGTSTYLVVKDGPSGYERISYLRFPLSELSGTATSAMLNLTVVAIGGEGEGDRTIEIRQLADDDDWSETGTTWNNRPSTSGTLIATIQDAGTVGQTYSIDVTDYVNAQSQGDGMASFVVIQPDGTSRVVIMASREDTDNQPTLEVRYDAMRIDAEADTYVYGGSPASNYGTSTTLVVKDASGTSYDRITYLRFPLSSMSAAATNATLNLAVTAIGGEGEGPRTVQLRQLSDDSWSETGITWNNRPSSAGTLIATFDAQPADQLFSIDVTDYINAEYAGDGTVSFVLVQPTDVAKWISFGSRENATEAYRPVLEVE